MNKLVLEMPFAPVFERVDPFDGIMGWNIQLKTLPNSDKFSGVHIVTVEFEWPMTATKLERFFEEQNYRPYPGDW